MTALAGKTFKTYRSRAHPNSSFRPEIGHFPPGRREKSRRNSAAIPPRFSRRRTKSHPISPRKSLLGQALRFRAVDREIFEAIRSGTKTVETRAATERYRNITAGDEIIFLCGKDSFRRQVRKAQIFRTVEALLSKYKVKDINPNVASVKELKAIFASFPGYREKIRRHGLIALKLI